VVWNALQLAVADAEVSPELALGVVAAAVPQEPLEPVVNAVLTWAQQVAGWSDDPRWLELVAHASAATFEALPVDARLVAARALIGCSTDVELLRRWSSGLVPDGVPLDRDVRWRLLTRLCELGAADRAEIEAALAADASSEGAVRAARCRASLPDPDAKDDAWQLLMTDGDAANSTLYAIADGFWQPAQRALTEPFVARYFREIRATATLRSGWVVGRVAARAYPHTHPTPATVAASTELLADASLPSPIRRAVVDMGDDLRRVLGARITYDF
jgi:aminopeptidase N